MEISFELREARPDRRPIRAREHRVFQRLARNLSRAGVSANTISILGMICGILAGAALWATSHTTGTGARLLWLAAAVLVQLRLLANMLDGLVAEASDGIASGGGIGELYNDLPDRVSDSAILVALGYAAGGLPTLGWLAALMAMATAYVRAAGKAAGAGSAFCGPMAKPQRMFVVTVLAAWCAVAPGAWQANAAAFALWLIVAACIVTVARRIALVGRQLRERRA